MRSEKQTRTLKSVPISFSCCCRIKILLASLSLVIVLRAVKSQGGAEEVEEEPQGDTVEQKQNLARTGWDLLVGMFRTVFKRRPGWMQVVILLQLLAYTMYGETWIIDLLEYKTEVLLLGTISASGSASSGIST